MLWGREASDRRLLTKHLSTLTLCILLGLTGPGSPAERIKVGEFGSLTGDNASFGISQNNGVQLALEEVNAAGGVTGRKIDLIMEDNQTKPGETTAITRKLIFQDQVKAIIGEASSSKTLEAAPIAQAARIPLIATGATNPKVTETGNYIFRVCFTDDFQAVAISRFVLERLRLNQVAFLTDVKQDYSVGFTGIAKSYLAGNRRNDCEGTELRLG